MATADSSSSRALRDVNARGVRTRALTAGNPKKPTLLLVHDFLNSENQTGKIGVNQAALEWAAAGHGRVMGTAGCCSLYVTLTGRT